MTGASSSVLTEQRRRMTHDEWMTVASVEYSRLLEVLSALTDDDWQRPTDCDAWDVRQVVAHLVGAAESTASLRELMRIARLGRAYRPGVDGMNDLQVAERADASPDALVAALGAAGQRGVHARRRIPTALRLVRVPLGPPLGVRSVGYLMDRIYTRDAWMHRVDISRATGRPLVLTPEHDGRLVDDLVQEWAGLHRQPYRLELSGPAGGSWSTGAGGPALTMDAVEFARVLSGRAAGDGLLAHQVPF